MYKYMKYINVVVKRDEDKNKTSFFFSFKKNRRKNIPRVTPSKRKEKLFSQTIHLRINK